MSRGVLVAALTLLAFGCSSSPPANPARFCFNLESTVCLRERVADRATEAQFDTCQQAVGPTCAAFTFPAGCAPTVDEADECLRELRRNDALSTPSATVVASEICNLCPP